MVFMLLALLLGILGGLALLEIGMRYYAAYVRSQEQMDPGLLVYDPQLGWLMARNWSGRHRHHDFDVRYTTNDQGLRGPWPEPQGQPRYAFVGDSFTFGLGVNDDETFVKRLEDADPSTIYLNAGIAGFSTDQEYLYLKERLAGWRLDKMAVVVFLANDLLDNALRFPLQAQMAKPLFQLESGELRLTNVPVPVQSKPAEEQRRTLGTLVLGEEGSQRQESSWRNQWQLTRSLGLAEAADAVALEEMPQRLGYPMKLFVRLIQEIHKLCEENHVSVSVILMPGRSYVDLPISLSARFQDAVRQDIVARQAELGVPVIDLALPLLQVKQKTGLPLFHPNEGHLTAAGHRVVAELLR
jgi:lysophospholipase L1-like esterase